MSYNCINYGDIVSSASLVFAIIVFFMDRWGKIKTDITNGIDELFEFYYSTVKSAEKGQEYRVRIDYMSRLDRFAKTVINSRLPRRRRKHIVYELTGKFWIREYEAYIEEYIGQRRKQFKRDNYYNALEKMMKQLQKMDKKRKH